ncbi:PP2C family protein-serine/threonine phosphatase [Halobacteriovorax sp.]|uniref:PP2C family protein-serine/threonine phosphatase n=1 Tax=Halobacteriovorax sp. TaxID=2020862 RepID=UPI003AF2DAA0
MRELESFFARTHQGPYLNLNEDSTYINLKQKIFGIFDGFGGSGISDLNLESVTKSIENYFTKLSGDPNATMPYFYSPQYVLETNALVNAMMIAHKNLMAINKKKEMKDKGGVSVALTMLSENILSVVSCGNCVALLYREGALSQISAPDSPTQISTSDNTHHKSTFPLVALGLYEEISPKIWEVNVMPHDKVILLSDGVYGSLSLNDIKRVVQELGPDEVTQIDGLFNFANRKGNLDNQSAIIFSIL